MIETLFGILIFFVIFGVTLVTVYGAGLIIVEHFWVAVILLFFLTPLFFVWAFFRGLMGKRNDIIYY